MNESFPGNRLEYETPGVILEVCNLLGVDNPKDIYLAYLEQDQKLFKSGQWDYDDQSLVINKIKNILENIDPSALSNDENNVRDNIIWFWYHHAISCAIRKRDKDKAIESASRALKYQSESNPNKITKLLYFLVTGQYNEAVKWAYGITDKTEKSTALQLISGFEKENPFDIYQTVESQPGIVIAKNLDKIRKEMLVLLRKESMGGNAGTLEIGGIKFSAQGANGYADPETGEILAFGNPQDLEDEVKNQGKIFTFKVVNKNGIRKAILNNSLDFSPKAIAALQESAAIWSNC